ncbi:unnamed protein product [Sympodiomycopsis kandeliae]
MSHHHLHDHDEEEVIMAEGNPSSHLHHLDSPNPLQRFRNIYGPYIAEAFGAGTIILFGAGAQCQTQLYKAGDTLTCGFGWAIGVALGAYIAGPISGGHINPAVTIAQAAFRRFPLSKVPGYIFSQILGCFLATLLIYTNYHEAIADFEAGSGHQIFGDKGTAGNFISTPKPSISAGTAFYDEVLGTAILVGSIFAFTNPALPGQALALAVLFALLGIAIAVGAQTGFAINPARDFGPRLALTVIGYPGKTLWSHNKGYWFHSIWGANTVGALLGGGLVDLLLYVGNDSIFNKPPRLA